jgi:hypothetical protein
VKPRYTIETAVIPDNLRESSSPLIGPTFTVRDTVTGVSLASTRSEGSAIIIRDLLNTYERETCDWCGQTRNPKISWQRHGEHLLCQGCLEEEIAGAERESEELQC